MTTTWAVGYRFGRLERREGRYVRRGKTAVGFGPGGIGLNCKPAGLAAVASCRDVSLINEWRTPALHRNGLDYASDADDLGQCARVGPA